MIPKIIHYCWFGGNPRPAMVRICIDSWRKVLPDYEIKEWNESNFDMHSSPWIEKAYEAKKWAFVADYVRFKVLYEEGGLYFDTDIFLKKDISAFLSHRFFSQWDYPLDWEYLISYNIATKDGTFLGNKEQPKHMAMCGIMTAFMGAEKGHPLLKDCLKYYQETPYQGIDSSFKSQSIVCDDILLSKLWKYGLRMIDERQNLENGIVIYPSSTVAGSIKYIQKGNIAIHFCSSTWRDKHGFIKAIYKNILCVLEYMKLQFI